MVCFNSLRKRANCMVAHIVPSELILVSIQLNAAIVRRRMGVSSSGTIVMNDMYGEPIGTDIYNDIQITVEIRKAKDNNEENSKAGGRTENGMEKSLEFRTDFATDILKNDLIEFPVGSNEWFRVNEIDNKQLQYRIIYGVPEVRTRK